MRQSLIPTLRCPTCGVTGYFSVKIEAENAQEIREGSIICESCSAHYAIRAGVLDFLPPGSMRDEVTREVAGWIEAYTCWFDLTGKLDNFWLDIKENHQTRGISSDEFLRRLPNFERIAPVFHQRSGYQTNSYNEIMQSVKIQGTERLLDLGAARCWTTRDFARLGCRCVALDIVTTKYIGLESSDVYFADEPDIYWERVRGDMERLPFSDGSFDIIFCSAVLHHTKKLDALLDELHRVLALGGRIVVVNEPDYGWFDRRAKLNDQIAEASTGVNENLYSHRFLVKSLQQKGFDVNFRSPLWSMQYMAWQGRVRYESLGLKRGGYQFQKMIEGVIVRNQPLVRALIGLGTMGEAVKRA